jgi:hypothetical protein
LNEILKTLEAYESSISIENKNAKTNAAKSWKQHSKNFNSKLHFVVQAALDIICVPMTEVTANPLFSFLRFFSNELPTVLDTDLLEDILFSR